MEHAAGPSTTSSGSGTSRQPGSASSHSKPRSCLVCARRKVSCDKQFPCGRCQRAGIRCVLPAIEQRPRWARRLVETSGSQSGESAEQSLASSAFPDQILERFKLLESLVRDLRAEMEQHRASASTGASHADSQASAGSSIHAGEQGPPPQSTARGSQKVSTHSSDLSSRFWSGVDHELEDFTDKFGPPENDKHERVTEGASSQAQATTSTAGADSAHMSRSLLSIGASVDPFGDTSGLLPMLSQMPFLLDVYSERVHSVICIPHMPSLHALFRQFRTKERRDSTASESALLFAVLYSAVCSLDNEEVRESFNQSKTHLASDYRKGLEISLAKADFLANPSHELIEALLIFLTLARLHDSPKYLWMMTGIVIRMARFLRHHQDGAESKHTTPFQAEMQRRVWWNLCALDMRATEDQGTELTNPDGSFTTALPSNADESDIWPEMDHAPPERSRLTDASLLRLCSRVARCCQKMMALGGAVPLDHHVKLIENVTRELDQDYFSITDQSHHHAYLAAAGTMRVLLARLTLLAFFPALLSSPNANLSTEMRNKMLISGIEIAELNHALNTDPGCQPWRWVYQTQRHWDAVVYLLIEICRRPWSATIERAWLALQSPWLLPARASSYKNPSVWVPLRKLMNRARSHREEEIARLTNDPHAARRLEVEDREHVPIPSSSVTFPMYYNEETFRKRWRQLLSPSMEGSAVSSSTTSARATIAGQSGNASVAPSTRSHQFFSSATQRDSMQLSGEASGADMASSAEQWPGAAVNTSNSNNLDSFLGADAEIGLLDDMEDVDFLNFDWNSWFSSTSDAM